MSLASGTKLGPYEIQAPAGAGGMGEVYKALDTRLDRTVAIKVLPPEIAADPVSRQRLEREARSISKLSHPHICTLFDIGHQDGADFLVMEYLEGETLEQRLRRGPLPIAEALRHACDIVDALEKAHRQGIVHRDLKPGNIMLTKSGVKLLDFGLAKPKHEAVPMAVALSEMTTETRKLTAEGALVGTLQYMAPEQLEGKEADGRADIFAFGAVLYEMLTGHPAFTGKSKASLIAAILSSEPPAISSLQPLSPPALDRVVANCLAKDPEDRWQTAHDLKLQLQSVAEPQAALAGPVAFKRKYRERAAWVAAGILFVLATAFGLGYLRRAPKQERAMHFSIALPSSVRDLALSPDGRILAFIAPRPNEGGNVLWLHEIGSTGMLVLEDTEGASYPFWSPDSRSIGFFADGKLKRIEAAGGPVQVLCDASFGRGAAWNRDGVIVFAPNPSGGLARVPAAGGIVTALTEVPAGTPNFVNVSHRWPSFLPDGRHFVYSTVDFTDRRTEANAIYVAALDSREQHRLVTSDSNAVYVPSGYLIFSRNATLMAQRFDADRLQLTGEPFAVANDVEYLSTVARALFSVSQTGTLIYQSGSSAMLSQLQWSDRDGKRLAALGAPANYANPRISPDGKKVALDIDDSQSFDTDVWVLDLGRGVPFRFTFDSSADETPIWSPDGNRIFWLSQRGGGNNFYVKRASGSGTEDALYRSVPNLLSLPTDWSRDGRWLLYTGSRSDYILQMWILSVDGERKPTPFVHSQSSEVEGQFSPDGHWVAYSSNESGRWQVYVARFPGPGGKYQVSTNGGQQPRWRRDGKELFFLSPDKKLMAVSVRAGTTFEFGAPAVLFQTRTREPLSAEEVFTYDVSPDGQRFLINVNLEQGNPMPANIVLNWSEDLLRK